MSAGRCSPGISGNTPQFLGTGVPNSGGQDLADAAAGSESNRGFSGCSTFMPNATQEVPVPGGVYSGSMSRAAEQYAGTSSQPPSAVPAGFTQVPISIVVFHRRLTGRGSRPQLPMSGSMPAPALPGVSQDEASIQHAGSDFLSLGRASNTVAGDMLMNPSQLATQPRFSSEYGRLDAVHFQPNGLDTEASGTGVATEACQFQQSTASVFCGSHNKLEAVIPANNMETQVQQSQESNVLLPEGFADDSMYMYQPMQKRHKTEKSDHIALSTPSAFKKMTQTQVEMHMAGAAKSEAFKNVEETPTRKPKTRRKKHRAKVIREDKRAKKQKPVSATPEGKSPNQRVKRSYVRKKKDPSSQEKCTGPVSDQSISRGKGIAARTSVRRSLQFELEEKEVQEDQSSVSNLQHHDHEKIIHAQSSFCSATGELQVGHGMQVDMENSPGGFAFGMSRKLNELLNEYIHLPEIPQEVSNMPSGSFARELAGEQDNVGRTHEPDATSKSRLCIEESMGIEGNKKDLELNYSSTDYFQRHRSAGSLLLEMESTRNQMLELSAIENHPQHNDSGSSLTGTRDSIILKTAAEMLAFCQDGGIKKKRSARVRRNSFVPIMHLEKNTSQVSIGLPQPCMDALYESSYIKFITKKRSQKPRAQSPSSLQPNMELKNKLPDSSFYGESFGSIISQETFQKYSSQIPDNKIINHDIHCEVPERTSANTSTPPYTNYLEGMASKLRHLDLNREQVHRTEMHLSMTTPAVISFGATNGLSNALVPYGGDAVAPYEMPLQLLKKQRPRAKVDLDFETTRVWNLLMGNTDEPVDGTDVEKERWWQQERDVFQGRANSFIARMRLVQGDRRFSPWKGSVVDSVVGVFLTQNVADHLSSSAFMALAASFPSRPVNNNYMHDTTTQANEESISTSALEENDMFDPFYDGTRPDLRASCEELSIAEPIDNTCASELIIGENSSLYYKSTNESICNNQRSGIEHIAKQTADLSSVGLSGSTEVPQQPFQKEILSCKSVITSGAVLQSRLSLSSGIPRNFVVGGDTVASQQVELGDPSSSTMPFVSTIDHQQLDLRNEPNVSSTSSNSSTGSASPNLTNGTIEKKNPLMMQFDYHATERSGNRIAGTTFDSPITRTELPGKIHDGTKTSFEASGLHEHGSPFVTGEMTSETARKADECTLKSGFTSYNGIPDTAAQASSSKKTRTTSKRNMENFDWDKLRRQAYSDGHIKERISERRDSVDWEAVRCADVQRISYAIRERGMNNVLSERIQSFLNRLVRDHGSIDLEWLRDIPPDSAKDYLLSIRGLGLKSVECVRLLTLHHLAFPVDTNVGRICVRLGWVPIQPLPESLQLHLLELYPVLATIQKYIWPRLCKLDQQTLYELHYQMITFGKVFCTKSKPNCNACPMRSECRHFASAFASARLALPAPQDGSLVKSSNQFAFQNSNIHELNSTALPRLEGIIHGRDLPRNSEPIIEEPASPREEECLGTMENDIEDFDEDGEIPTIKLNMEAFARNLEDCIKESNKEFQSDDIAKALVAISTEAASIPAPKLKNVHRLRTEHYVYELPDSHPLVQQLGLDRREPDDPSPYLLAIWTPDDIKEMSKAPKPCCASQMEGSLCNNFLCPTCVTERENQSRYVRGTILIPCRTAMRGSFPLNGTYFQVNEVFADHKSSHNPIHVAREQLWNLQRRMVFFGTSVPTIFKGLTTGEIQQCFWRGFVCVRGFDMETRSPRPLCPHLHVVARPKSRKTAAPEQVH
ncbi:hypothetical protein ACP4OV_028609 [Aristida adscensionis]